MSHPKMNKWPMYLTREIERAAKEHEDPKTIASLVGAEYESQADFIEALIEEILHLKHEWDPKVQMRDACREDGPAPADGEEAESFDAEIIRSSESFMIVFSRPGDVRKLFFEQNNDDIRIESVSDYGGPDATILLRESDTEVHDVAGSLTAVRFDNSKSGRPYNPNHISKR